MPTRLYDLAVAYRRVLDQIDECDGELSPTLEAELSAVDGPFEDKLDAIGHVLDELETNKAGHKRVADRHSKRAKIAENAITRLKSWAMDAMRIAGIKRFDGEIPLRIQANPPKARWIGDPDKIPDKFKQVKTEISLDGSAVLAADKAGEELPIGIVISRGSHLRVG